MVGTPEPDPIRILVIDDNPADVDLLKYAFESSIPAEFTAIRDGQLALDRISGHHAANFDLILVDWQLPGAQGNEVAKAYLGVSRPASVVVLSSALPAKAAEDLRRAGAVVLEKPLDLDGYDDLVKRLIALASRPRPEMQRSATASLTSG